MGRGNSRPPGRPARANWSAPPSPAAPPSLRALARREAQTAASESARAEPVFCHILRMYTPAATYWIITMTHGRESSCARREISTSLLRRHPGFGGWSAVSARWEPSSIGRRTWSSEEKLIQVRGRTARRKRIRWLWMNYLMALTVVSVVDGEMSRSLTVRFDS